MLAYVSNIGLGYLLGSVPVGLIVGYIWLRRDIREIGSGKTGATNVLRTAGKVPAAVAVAGDIAKGAIPALVGRYFWDDAGVAALGAAAAIVGHIWPVFAGFRGGRGVAAAFGGILALTPFVSIGILVFAAVLVLVTRYVSVMSIVGTAVAGTLIVVLSLVGVEPTMFAVYAIIAVALIEYMHIPNIRRLLAGTEPRIGRGGDRPATG